ncbi:MAG TPA: hypothetical protein VF406_02075 [Thermodesulfobacteriota bacterium]
MTPSRPAVLVTLLVAGMVAGCAVASAPGGPPPHAPAHGARAKRPPRITITPTVVLIAGTQVAFAENYPGDLFYFQGRWYRPYDGRWWWSVTVNGEWVEIAVGQVPRAVLEVPRDYRRKAVKGGPPPWAPAHGRRAKDRS